MDDVMSRELLRLLVMYVEAYAADMHDMSISELASDLAMSLDVTTEVDDERRRYIEEALA
jgi:hypothetical protein